MHFLRAYLRTLNPPLPSSVRTLQAGALVNALGNGLAYPFLFIYLHNVRGIDLATAGLIVGTNSAVGLVAGPIIGSLIDRIGGRVTLAGSLAFLAIGFGSYAFVETPWQGFLASAIAGIGNGGFWPSQSSLIAGLTPKEQRHQAFAMQRVMMNLGIGLGGLAGGLIATTSDPNTFTVLFLADAATFLVYSVFLLRVPAPPKTPRPEGRERGGYGEVVRNRVFMAVVTLNFVFIGAGMAQLETLPVYAKNEAGVTESGIGLLFFLNTLVIVLSQLPMARLLEGHRRMRTLARARCRLGGRAHPRPDRGRRGERVGRLGLPRAHVRDHRRRRVPPRNRPGAPRRRSRRPQPDRPVHGGLGVLLGRRVRARPSGGRPGAQPLAARALARRRSGLPGGRRRRARARTLDPGRGPNDAEARAACDRRGLGKRTRG